MTVQWVPIGSVLRRRLEAVMVEPDERYSTFGVRNNFRGAFDAGDLLGADTKYKVLYRARAGDLVYLKLGAWERAFAMIPEELDQHVASSEFVLYEPDVQRIDPRFLSHLMAWPALLDGIGGESKGTNVRRRRLSPDVFEAARIPLPDLPTQRSIASRLEIVSTAVATSPPVRHDRVSALRESLMEHSAAAGVPLGEILKFSDAEVRVEPDHVYPFAGVLGGGRGVLLRGSRFGRETSYTKLRRITSGQLVYSRLKAFEGAITIVPDVAEGRFVSSEFPTFDPVLSRVDAVWLGNLCRSSKFHALLSDRSQGIGARRERLSVKDFLRIEVPLPDLDVQRRMAKELDQISRVELLHAQRQHLLDSLLPAARNEEFRHLLAS